MEVLGKARRTVGVVSNSRRRFIMRWSIRARNEDCAGCLD